MILESHYVAIEQMLEDGTLMCVDDSSVDEFLAPPHPHLLFFPGPGSVKREAHDVAVALRELLRDYHGLIDGGLIADEQGPDLAKRFRANATPCLVLLTGTEVLEVIPRVRDWSDYAAAFARYLGPAPKALQTGTAA